jgi:stage II sporulation protein M
MKEENQRVSDPNGREYFQSSLWPYVLMAAALFLISLVAGLRIPPEFASGALEELKLALKPLAESFNPLLILLVIFLNNAIKALGAIVLGIVLGLPSLFFISANGFMIGVVVTALKSSAGYGVIAASLAPHGIIEIAILLLSSAFGLRIGWQSLRYLSRQKSSVKAQLRHSMKIYLKWILASLFVAAIIEVFITPLFILLAGGKELFMK